MKKVLRIVLYVFLSLALIALASVVWFFYGPKHSIHYNVCGKEVPISVPFDVSKKGETLSCDFVIEDKDYYTIYLVYLRESEKRLPYPEEVDDIAKGVTLKLTLSDFQEGPIISAPMGVKKIHIFDGRGYIAGILSTTLSKGEYGLSIESLSDVSELHGIKTEVIIMKSISVVK